MSDKIEQAAELFSSGYNCCQAVACGCGQGLGVDRNGLLAMGSVFGGGIARTGRVCGAVSGAIMVIGLKHPRLDPANRALHDENTRLARELIERFEARNGSIECRELLGFDIVKPDQAEKARGAGVFKTVCPRLVRDAAEILEEITGQQS